VNSHLGSRWLGRDESRPVRHWDIAVALCVAVLQVGIAALAATHRPHHMGAFNAITVALLAAGPLALLACRRWSAAVLAVCLAVALGYSLADYYPRGLVFPAVIVAFWAVMMAGRRRLGWLSIIGGYVLFVVLVPATAAQPPPGLAWAAGIAAWMLLLGAIAEIVRIRRERGVQAAAARGEQERRVAGEERLRIARELHDVLAHNLSMINVQAGVALHLIDERPEQTRAALSAIKHASKEALAELRSVLDVLRAPDERAPKAPPDGLSRLEQLIARTRDAGVPVSARIYGEPRSLPAGVDRAAYRIVQEALTNVVKHAAGAPAAVHLAYREREIVVQIDNDRRGTPVNGNPGGGNGIPGMRERAVALGGILEAGPTPRGGFRVRATLPLADAP
jgi:signal transduction histidine kinase